MAHRKFRVAMSERCYRFKPDALPSHAPHKPGVYEFVTFDADRSARVLYVGVALERSVYQSLDDHWNGRAQPGRAELFAVSPDVYFDYVAAADVADAAELKDIAGALIAKHKPRFNAGPVPSSGLHASVELEDA
ncbi:MAG: hypothetical protein HY552_04700 [Elusimicrobia bacterium]|nr:hypothetical protein [Elusimicrobiota bacterium]